MIPKIFRSSANPVQHRHVVNKILAISPQHLYSIVTDVDSYKLFLPFCNSSKILRRSNCGTQFDASLTIGVSNLPPLNAIEEEYVSRVRHVQQVSSDGRDEWIVEAKSIRSNLFHGLSSSWHLTTYTHGLADKDCANDEMKMTKVKFEVEMSVADPIISVAVERILENVAIQQIEAFERRCRDIPFNVNKEE